MIWLIERDSAAECAGDTQGQSFKIPAKLHPSRSYAFLVRMFGSKGEKHSFRTEWCGKYHWLHYNLLHSWPAVPQARNRPTIHTTRQLSDQSG